MNHGQERLAFTRLAPQGSGAIGRQAAGLASSFACAAEDTSLDLRLPFTRPASSFAKAPADVPQAYGKTVFNRKWQSRLNTACTQKGGLADSSCLEFNFISFFLNFRNYGTAVKKSYISTFGQLLRATIPTSANSSNTSSVFAVTYLFI